MVYSAVVGRKLFLIIKPFGNSAFLESVESKLKKIWNDKVYSHLYNKNENLKSNEVSSTSNGESDQSDQKVENSESEPVKAEKVSANKSNQEMENSKPETTKSYKFPLEETDKSDLKIKNPESTKKNSEIKKNSHYKKEEETKKNFFEKIKDFFD